MLHWLQAKPDTEFSELVLYEVQVMMEGDMHEAALKHMNSFESSICDTGCLFENKGREGVSIMLCGKGRRKTWLGNGRHKHLFPC